MTTTSTTDHDFAEIDVTDLDVFAERYPAEWFQQLRAQAPVYLHPGSEGSDGEDFWLVTSYRHVTEVHKAGLLYSHQTGPGRDGAGGIALTDQPPELGPGLMMVSTDPPQHTRYRKLVNTGFTPRMIRRLEEALRQKTNAILDRITPLGECDFVVDVAAELPLLAIAEIIGVPAEDRARLFDWSNRMIGGQDSEYGSDGDPGEEYGNVVMEMAIYAHELTDHKRADPGDDVWTRLTDAQVTMEDGTTAELTDLERDLFMALLVVAGNETTRNAISKGLMAFMEHRDQWDRWIAHPELSDTMVDEILRYTSPVNFFRRTATADTELGGQQIRAGQKVVLWYPSANRDEAEFGPTADDFDIGRTPNHHVAFGAGGPHYCLGANLAKLEIKVMFEELARRVPDIELAGPAARLRMNLVDAIKHQPVTYTPSPALG